MSFSDKLYKILIQGGSWKTILGGLWVTVQISFFALLLGTVLGALICLLRTRKNPVARLIASVYIAILRGTPVLMLLLLLYYGVFARSGVTPIMVAVITFALNVSAHVAELLRSARRGRWFKSSRIDFFPQPCGFPETEARFLSGWAGWAG